MHSPHFSRIFVSLLCPMGNLFYYINQGMVVLVREVWNDSCFFFSGEERKQEHPSRKFVFISSDPPYAS